MAFVPPAAATPDSACPPEITDYELLRLIGGGAYGDVWLARGLTGLFRAIKVVSRSRFDDPLPFEREFKGLREFAALAQAESRQLALLHVGRNDPQGFFYYVMELADDAETGRDIDPSRYVPLTLRELRLRHRYLSASRCVEVGIDLCRALSSLHSHGLVHRDIKPSNVIFVGGTPKLADVGLVASVAQAVTFVGTEGFVPPEGPGTPGADVYGLGKLLYEIATGCDRTDFPRLPEDVGERPDRDHFLELNEVVLRACEPNPNHRYADAAALLDELALLQSGRSVRRLHAAERSLARSWRALVAMAAIAAIAGAGALIERQHLAHETFLRHQAEDALERLARENLYSASLVRAQQALTSDDYGIAREALQAADRARPLSASKALEWALLAHDSAGDAAAMFTDNGPPIEGVCISPDGRIAATEAQDGVASLWDLKTRRKLTTIPGVHRVVSFSADGHWLYGTNPAITPCRWSVPDGRAEPAAASGTHIPIAVIGESMFSLASRARRGEWAFREWDFAARRQVVALPFQVPDPADWDRGAQAVSADGKFAVAYFFRTAPPRYHWKLQCYSLSTGHLISDDDHVQPTATVAFSPDARLLVAAGSDDSQVRVSSWPDRRLLWQSTAEVGLTSAVAFSPDGQLLAVGGRSSRLRLLDARTGRPIRDFRGQSGGILGIAWMPDSQGLLTCGGGGDLRRWSVQGDRPVQSLAGLYSGFGNELACLSPDGSRFAATLSEDRLEVRSLQDSSAAPIILKSAVPLGFDREVRDLLAIDRAGVLQRWRLEPTPQLLDHSALLVANAVLADAALASDQSILVTGQNNGVVAFWHLPERTSLGSFPAHGGSVQWIEVSADGHDAITSGADRSVTVWTCQPPAVRSAWISSPRARDAAFSHDGRLFALCFESGEVEIRDRKTLQVIRRLKTDSPILGSVAFSKEDDRLLCGGSDGLRIYATGTWRSVATLEAVPRSFEGNPTICSLASSSDDSVVLAYLRDGRARVWRKGNYPPFLAGG